MPYKNKADRVAYDRRRRRVRPEDRKRPDPDRFDEMEIDYVWITRDFGVQLSPLEKAEIVQRWKRAGRSLNSLARLSGWNVHRYTNA